MLKNQKRKIEYNDDIKKNKKIAKINKNNLQRILNNDRANKDSQLETSLVVEKKPFFTSTPKKLDKEYFSNEEKLNVSINENLEKSFEYDTSSEKVLIDFVNAYFCKSFCQNISNK
jgi:hypothetical protein